jgi:hypothetical protein
MKQIKKYPGLMKSYLKNWNGMRTLRLALGVFVTLQASLSGDWLFILLGVLFSLLSVFNVGCCAAGTCNTSPPRRPEREEEISYEEVR